MERRRLDGDVHALVATRLERRDVLAVFTERTGGVSPAPFASLNLGFRTGDKMERVARNRTRVIEALSVPPFATGEQVHGARVVRVGDKRAGAGFRRAAQAVAGTDGLAVSRRGVAVAILVADCLPLVMASPDLVVAAHVGWRGLASGIVDRAVAMFRGGGGQTAALGPAIGPCHYEVGEDVSFAVAAGSAVGARIERRDGRIYLDLPGTVAGILRASGVTAVERAEECTACQEERFFSHRRDGRTGRQAAVAMRL
jgi:YfiH family protein